MNSELISVRAWIEKHSFDLKDSFSFLIGKTLDGTVVRSPNTKVSEAALDSYINDVRAAQKRKPVNKGVALIRAKLKTIAKPKAPPKPAPEAVVQKNVTANNSSIRDKFIEAAEKSKKDADGYILMNEFAQSLKATGIEWKGPFKTFLKKYNDIIEFKPNAPYNAPAIKLKKISVTAKIQKSKSAQPKQTENVIDCLKQKLEEADKIYIDTCALMETPIEKFFEKANPILKKLKKKIIVILAVELELKKIAKPNDEKKYTPEQIKKAENVLASEVLYPTRTEIEISASDIDDDGVADPIFISTFVKYKRKYKMLLITQDFNLASDILNMNESKSSNGKRCVVCKIDNEGNLKYFESHKPE